MKNSAGMVHAHIAPPGTCGTAGAASKPGGHQATGIIEGILTDLEMHVGGVESNIQVFGRLCHDPFGNARVLSRSTIL